MARAALFWRVTDEEPDGSNEGPDGVDEELTARVARLERTVERLLDERDRRDRSARSALGLRLPAPREVARLTADRGVPAAVQALELQIRVLELLGDTLDLLARGADRGGPDRRSATDPELPENRAVRDRLLERLGELEAALSTDRPTDPLSRSILREARTLREELRSETERASRESLPEPGEPDAYPEDRFAADEQVTRIDVESELQTIRDEVGRDADRSPGGGIDADEKGGDEGAKESADESDDESGGEGHETDASDGDADESGE